MPEAAGRRREDNGHRSDARDASRWRGRATHPGIIGSAAPRRSNFADASFDLVVSYITLVDIPDFRAAIREMARVLRPGGALLMANLTGYISACIDKRMGEG